MEGVWCAPDTVDKALAIVELLKSPIPANKASDLLYNLIGDDDLFDQVQEVIDKDGPNSDVRPIVKSHVMDLVNNYNADDWNEAWDADAIRILQYS